MLIERRLLWPSLLGFFRELHSQLLQRGKHGLLAVLQLEQTLGGTLVLEDPAADRRLAGLHARIFAGRVRTFSEIRLSLQGQCCRSSGGVHKGVLQVNRAQHVRVHCIQ